MKVVDMETREKLGPEQVGEICVLSDTLSPGYLNNPDANASSRDEEGFFLSGDAGEFHVQIVTCPVFVRGGFTEGGHTGTEW